MRQGAEDSSWSFTDDTFTFPESIHWPDLYDEWLYSEWEPRLHWARIKDRFGGDSYSMWGSQGIAPEDAIQGTNGNCWLLAAAISIAESEERLNAMFTIKEKNSASVYATQLFLLGMPITVVIDDHLPMINDSVRQLPFSRVGKDGALWGPLFEKSVAKYYGNYEFLEGGAVGQGVEVARGSPFYVFEHEAEDFDAELLWDALVEADSQGHMISSGSYVGTGSDKDVNWDGLPYNHAFSILKVFEVKLATGTT